MGLEYDPEKLEDLPSLLSTLRPALLGTLERGEKTSRALVELKNAPENWTPTGEAKIRLAALSIVEECVANHAQFMMKTSDHYVAGAGEDSTLAQERREKVAVAQKKWEKAMDTLGELRKPLGAVLDVAEEVETELGPLGVHLDPEQAGGGRIKAGKRGAPPTILTWCVKHLLRQRFDWDGTSYFPEKNTADLREWLRNQLRGDPSDLSPFPDEQIDPRSKGPLFKIISNLRRLQ